MTISSTFLYVERKYCIVIRFFVAMLGYSYAMGSYYIEVFNVCFFRGHFILRYVKNKEVLRWKKNISYGNPSFLLR